jgi:DNA-binding NarL/FixJ family response regulator
MAKQLTPAKIVVVDDHPVFRQGVRALLGECKEYVVCGEAEDPHSAMRVIAEKQPDLVTLDISLKTVNGLNVLKDIRAQFPKVKVVMISMHDEVVFAPRAFKAGASGYLMKDAVVDAFLGAIRKVLDGEIYVSEKLSNQLLSQFASGSPKITSPIEKLSDRELEVLTLIGSGFRTREVAEKLHLSIKTIEAHCGNLKEKLNLRSACQLLYYAMNWVQTGEPEAATLEQV